MNCELVQRRLLSSDAPDRPPTELRQHLDECPSCSAWHEQLAQVERQLPLLLVPLSSRKTEVMRRFLDATEPVISANGSDSTFAPILSFTQPTPRERGLRKASLAIAMAAGLAVFALGWWAWQQQPPPVATPPNPIVALRDDLDQQLKQARTKPEKVDVVARLADHHRREALSLAQSGDANQLAYTAQFYTELVRDHLPRYAKEMTPAERQQLLPGIAEQLERTNSALESYLSEAPKLSTTAKRNLKQMADEARDSQVKVQKILRGEV